MKFITVAFFSLPFSEKEAKRLELKGETVGEQLEELLARARKSGFRSEAGGPSLKWMAPGSYLYISSVSPKEASEVEAWLKSIESKLLDSLCISTTWGIRPDEKSLDYPPSREDLLVFLKK